MSTGRKSHRTIWAFTAMIFALAMIVLAVRVSLDTTTEVEELHDSLSKRDEAVARMTLLLEKDPRVRRERTRAAVEDVTTFSDAPDLRSAEVHYAVGLQKYYGKYEVQEAEDAFRSAAELKPEWSWARNALGIVLFASGREDEGMAAFAEAKRLDPEWTRPYNDLAILYRRAGDIPGAEREIKRALEMDPGDPITHYNYGVLLDVQGEAEAAKMQYERVIDLDPGLPAAHYNLACGYARRGDVDSALTYLRQAIGLEHAFRDEAMHDPDFDRVRETAPFTEFVSSEGGEDRQE